MKKAAICGLIFAFCIGNAGAQSTEKEYATNWDGQKSENTNRYLQSVTFTPVSGKAKTVQIHSAVRQDLVVDKTSEKIYVLSGSSLQVSVNVQDQNTNAIWLNAYVYVDEGKDGKFNLTVNESEKTLSGDIKAWSFYSFSIATDTSGKNDVGTDFANDNTRATRDMSAFNVPSEPGEYRLRVKTDWNNVNPGGSKPNQTVSEGGGAGIDTSNPKGLQSFGGTIVDFILVVLPEASFANETKQSGKGDITAFQITPTRTPENATTSLSSLPTGSDRKIYNCLTDQTLNVKCGDKLTATVTYGNNAFMHAYLYVDEDQDGKYSFDIDETNHKAAKKSDLKSWSFFGSKTDENNGYNSEGTALNKNNNSGGSDPRKTQVLPSFYAPQKPGTYLARIMIDWNNINPKGVSSTNSGAQDGQEDGNGRGTGNIKTNGGEIIDFLLKVEEDPASEEDKTKLTNEIAKAKSIKEKMGSGLGQYQSETYSTQDAFNTIVEEANDVATNTPNYTAVDVQTKAVEAALQTFIINQPEANKFYLFKTSDNSYITAGESDQAMSLSANNNNEDNTAEEIFYLDNEKHLVSFKNGLMVKDEGKMRPVSETTTQAATFDGATAGVEAVGKYTVKVAEKYLTKSESQISVSKEETAEAGWTMVEATTLPVTITDAMWATLYTPVALTIPEGVEAFTGNYNNRKLVLTALNGTIPAKTAVILHETGEHQSTPYSFQIATVATTEAIKNSLYGQVETELKTGTHYTGKKVYTLAKGNDQVGLYQYKDSNNKGVRGFGASLVIEENGSEAQAIAFDFTPTGIEEFAPIVTTNAPQAVYDLSGRRVTFPSKGIYIINGEKKIVR